MNEQKSPLGAPGKTALITGGGSGIGAATAMRLRAAGCNVLITGRRPAPLQQVADMCGAVPVCGDVTSQIDLDRAVAMAIDRFGGLDYVVANAGSLAEGSAETISDVDWNHVLEVNVTAVQRTLKAAIPALRARGGGSAVLVSSVAGLTAGPQMAAYIASKAAVIGLAKSAAVDFGVDGIRVNALCPGWVLTEMSEAEIASLAASWGMDRKDAASKLFRHLPLARIAQADEIASCIEFLLGEASSFVTGSVLVADGGGHAVDVGMLAFAGL